MLLYSKNNSYICGIKSIYNMIKGHSLLLLAGLMACNAAFAQGQFGGQTLPNSVAPVTNINPNGYPRLLADNSVAFRLRAPEAKNVQIDLCGKKYDMNRSEDGWWSVTSQPQVPGFHYYSLVVDGVSTADPASESFYGCSRWSSAIEIPEKGCDVFETQQVAHGRVSELRYFSAYTESWRPVLVYTPASYDKDIDKVYPVVYIHHGGGEDHRGWVEQGRMANIMDNLIAQGKAKEMVVVCVNSNVPAKAGSRGGYSWEGMQSYKMELTENIMPFIEKNFRVGKDAKHRAICGLSMGGGQSFYIGLRMPELFANVALFSTGIFGGIAGSSNFDPEKEIPGMYSNTTGFNKNLDTFFISCGEQDPRINFTRTIVSQMQVKGVKVRFASYPGDHEWQVWRKSFNEYAQMLFK